MSNSHLYHPLFKRALRTILGAETDVQYEVALKYAHLCLKKYQKETSSNGTEFILDILETHESVQKRIKQEDKKELIEDIKSRIENDSYIDHCAIDDIKFLLRELEDTYKVNDLLLKIKKDQ